MSNAVLLPGSLFADRYLVEKCIAQGGMGAVYEVVHAQTGRRHALKAMHAHTLSSADLRERFRQEARVAANVQSEFIVDVLDAGVDAATNLPFLVMELLQGEELGRLLQKRGRFSPADTVTFLGQVAMALDKTHRAMIVHRDLKPENLFLTYRDDGSPRVKVLDFGVAKIVAETSTHAAATRSVGTPLYMAPEQFQPGNKVSPSTDLFSLALIAYTFLVGKSYWAEEAAECANVFAFATTAIRGPLEPACTRAHRAGINLAPAFNGWFARAAHPDPSMRFPHASSMIRALSEAFGVPYPFRSSGDPLGGSGSNPAYPPPPPPLAVSTPSFQAFCHPGLRHPGFCQPGHRRPGSPQRFPDLLRADGVAAFFPGSSGAASCLGFPGFLGPDNRPACLPGHACPGAPGGFPGASRSGGAGSAGVRKLGGAHRQQHPHGRGVLREPARHHRGSSPGWAGRSSGHREKGHLRRRRCHCRGCGCRARAGDSTGRFGGRSFRGEPGLFRERQNLPATSLPHRAQRTPPHPAAYPPRPLPIYPPPRRPRSLPLPLLPFPAPAPPQSPPPSSPA